MFSKCSKTHPPPSIFTSHRVHTCKNSPTVSLIWVHRRIRLMGFGRFMLKQRKVKVAKNPVNDSEGFYEKCGIDTVKT